MRAQYTGMDCPWGLIPIAIALGTRSVSDTNLVCTMLPKRSSLPVICLRNPGILNYSNLMLNDKGGHLDSFKINAETFRTFRGSLFLKQITGRELHLDAQYIQLALELRYMKICNWCFFWKFLTKKISVFHHISWRRLSGQNLNKMQRCGLEFFFTILFFFSFPVKKIPLNIQMGSHLWHNVPYYQDRSSNGTISMLNHLEHSGFTAIIPSKEMMVPMGLWSSETIQVFRDVSELVFHNSS